ncbi:MAG: N-acetylmuramoyl-L-alanine amidase [Ignavibacteria bacterium]|nr:N-acetylmuramoyl-L-alanine amidase [Ignavibacteria bacterium]
MLKNLFKTIFILSFILYSGCSTNFIAKENKIIIHPRNTWGANYPKPFKSHTTVRITIHHEGTYFPQDSLAFRHIKNIQIWGMGEKKWADVPYHFFIDGFGNIIEGRNIFTAGETNTSYNPEGHILISIIGEYHKSQKLNADQYNSLINLITHLCKKYQISPDSIRGHRDYCKPNETDCPGDNIYQFIESRKIIDDVKKKIKE